MRHLIGFKVSKGLLIRSLKKTFKSISFLKDTEHIESNYVLIKFKFNLFRRPKRDVTF